MSIARRNNPDPVSDVAGQVFRRAQKECEIEASAVDFLHTGCHVLNLAASQKGRGGGWARGRIINLVGDGSSGKTLTALEACAQAYYRISTQKARNFPDVKRVQIVYNNAEGVMDFPLEKMYGQRFRDGVEWIQTPTCEEFGRDYIGRVDALKPGEFLLYVVDSLDSMSSEAGLERMDKSVKSGKATDGTYGTEKAKYLSSDFFNTLCGKMKGKDATLIAISQIREKIGITFGEKHYRAGGKALDFYTHQVCWLAQVEKLRKTFTGHERVYGVKVRARFKRNKCAMPFREADFPILFDYGIDDIGATADFLFGPKDKKVEWGDWSGSKNDLVVTADKDAGLYDDLLGEMEARWEKIESETRVERRGRFEE